MISILCAYSHLVSLATSPSYCSFEVFRHIYSCSVPFGSQAFGFLDFIDILLNEGVDRYVLASFQQGMRVLVCANI